MEGVGIGVVWKGVEMRILYLLVIGLVLLVFDVRVDIWICEIYVSIIGSFVVGC